MKRLLILSILFCSISQAAVNPQMGEYYGGGIIFYINPNHEAPEGQRGLIVAVEDASVKRLNIYQKTTHTPSTERDLFTGRNNTELMMLAAKNAKTLSPAATAAHNYTTKDTCPTCTPWFLPSRAELRMMYRQKSIIDSGSKSHGGQPIFALNYWSSSQVGSKYAWAMNFDDSAVDANANAIEDEFYVRAIRAF